MRSRARAGSTKWVRWRSISPAIRRRSSPARPLRSTAAIRRDEINEGAEMSGILAGRRAYVTGGSSGIGAAIVKTFAEEGARVAIGAARHADEARAMARDLPSSGEKHIVVQADLHDRQQTERAADEVIAGLGGLDIFVHSAGIDVTQTAPTHETSDELWDQMITLHLTAAFRLSKRLIPALLKGKNPSIVFIGSVCGLVAWQDDVAYNVAKARSEEHTSELQSQSNLVCRLLLEK